MEWHYFTVVDTYTGLDRDFRWREAICDYCGFDYRFQMYDGVCGRWIPVMSFLIWMMVLGIVVILILRNFIGLMEKGGWHDCCRLYSFRVVSYDGGYGVLRTVA